VAGATSPFWPKNGSTAHIAVGPVRAIGGSQILNDHHIWALLLDKTSRLYEQKAGAVFVIVQP
jgi:hypothetical protein